MPVKRLSSAVLKTTGVQALAFARGFVTETRLTRQLKLGDWLAIFRGLPFRFGHYEYEEGTIQGEL